ncbi:unnamed protein product [Schistosoma margrebowiei]|uniref:Uncharacterized protein n=1 Tax=Schistosoma margrebowiei TaxID=48269 RepID=A0A183LF40_9TREM|nr:unnamed protein product [Schistosoma margrebowiei]
MKTSTSGWRKHGIQCTARIYLHDLDFTGDLAVLSHIQKQMQEKTTSVEAAPAAVGLNVHKGKRKVLRYNTTCINQITQMFFNSCLHEILRVRWTDTISNNLLWERTN